MSCVNMNSPASRNHEDGTRMEAQSWLKRTAICWSAINASTAHQCYWDEKLLSQLSSADGDDTNSVSYQSLILVTVHVLKRLRTELCIAETSTDVPIVIAIPEGPLLPLAVLAIHVLNHHGCGAIMVPMDPSEAKERLRHMMNDVQPVVVLCVGHHDLERMRNVTNERNRVVDFSQIAKEAIEQDPCATCRIQSYLKSLQQNQQQSFVEVIVNCLKLLDSGVTLSETTLERRKNRPSHIVYTSGTTGVPKGCVSSIRALQHYVTAKNEAHCITYKSVVLLASSLSFDPCLSDIIATMEARATLAVAPRKRLLENLGLVLSSLRVTHVLCTPTLWSMLHVKPSDLPCLKVVALGGEAISKRMLQAWARSSKDEQSRPRLLATYGVTEACVYQTCGEVFRQKKHASGQDVGRPLRGCFVEIWDKSQDGIGEVVVHGLQVDEFSEYLHQPELTNQKFLKRIHGGKQQYSYRTGDLGFIDPSTNRLHILGRIEGEDGMVKINGVRVELGEIESAIVDDDRVQDSNMVVKECLAVAQPVDAQDTPDGPKKIYAYIVLGQSCLREMNISSAVEGEGIMCSSGPLLTLLRTRCLERVRQGCVPSSFVIISRVPTSATGKCDRRKLPPISMCISMDTLQGRTGNNSVPLWEYGAAGAVVAGQIIACLNLQPCQVAILTSSSSFGMLGGDSLSATRIVRSLYALHHGVDDTRFLGGSYGVLEEPFSAMHLLRAETMGKYIDWLDQHGVCKTKVDNSNVEESQENRCVDSQLANIPTPVSTQDCRQGVQQYEALMEASTLGYSAVAMALLDLGVDPNLGGHGGRLSKVSDRRQRKKDFKSNPLHLACSRGMTDLTRKALEKGCKFNSPDASGLFPLHLACSGINNESRRISTDAIELKNIPEYDNSADEDQRRVECVKLLLDAGAPLSMRDGNKQTVLHCAARSGHCKLLRFLMHRWKEAENADNVGVCNNCKKKVGGLDPRDRWFRTPVHWAVLNGNVEALHILVDNGCSVDPPKPKGSTRQTSLEVENPLEICIRLYGETEGPGKEMGQILRNT